jgi:hypothetical protein
MFTLTFKTGGAAFCSPMTGEEDKYFASEEAARLLREIADELDSHSRYHGKIMDLNGNSIGEFELK